MPTKKELEIIRGTVFPMCGFDDCVDFNEETGESTAYANVVVPLFSPGMPEPYDWVISCEDCRKKWQPANPDLRPLWLVRNK